MRYLLLQGIVLSTSIAIGAEVADTAPDPVAPSIPYASVQVIQEGDSDAVIAEKAAKVLPRPNQTAWMRLERTFFIHFGPNTFRGVEWGDGRESTTVFNPTELDAEQWVRAVKEGGGTMVILVCKHHDGLCLWPSRYTKHSVAASPWRNGQGNLVREVADAARKYGVQLGVYLSPADLYQLRTNPTHDDGYYGNESELVRSVIPTEPGSFGGDPSVGRTPPDGFSSYDYEVDDYNRYFLNQLYELLTEYGPIASVWFDGANPDPSVRQTYDYAAWYDLIRKLQPNAVISVKGPDVRWVGNEQGIGRTTEWSVIPLTAAPDQFGWPDLTDRDLGSRDKLVPGSHLWWYPAEVNVPILYGWFWAANKRCRTAADLVDLYYQAVGRNGNWLLNLSPDSRGLIPDDQLAHLRLMSQVVDETFATNLAADGKLDADRSTTANDTSLSLDGNLDTWWEAAPGRTNATLTLTLPKPATFDVVSLQEAVDHRGQRIESFCVDVWDGSQWTQQDEQTTVGRKRLLRWSSPVTTDRLRVRILGARLEPTLAEIGVFKQAVLIQPPSIGDRDVDGAVAISDPQGLAIVYTTDGSMPTPRSTVYTQPINLPHGGIVNAACLAADGRLGMLASKVFSGVAPTGWKIVAADGQSNVDVENAAHAIDGDPATAWQSAPDTLPASLTVDMGRQLAIAGFSYLPRTGRNARDVVDRYRFETSVDGEAWSAQIDEGRFANIRNNPVLQEVTFEPIAARYFRFTTLSSARAGRGASAAEITVLPSEATNSPR